MTARVFADYDAAAVTVAKPLLVDLTGPSFSGKTWSALRLATGMQRVLGGDIGFADTENNRAIQYKDFFKFRHVPFVPPYSPEAYEQLIDYMVSRRFTVNIIDSMSHEHSGEGGVLDQIEEFMNDRYERAIKKGLSEWDAEKEAEKGKWTAQIKPKGQRKRLNRKIVSLGASAAFIFCYRANDVTRPREGGRPDHIGWTAETTSKLPYEMTVRFLLKPGSDGHPNLTPETDSEKMSVKLPEQFRGWFKPGLQLNEELGERLARWSVGEAAPVNHEATIRAEVKRLKWGGSEAVAFLRANFSKDTIAELTGEEQAKAVAELRKVTP